MSVNISDGLNLANMNQLASNIRDEITSISGMSAQVRQAVSEIITAYKVGVREVNEARDAAIEEVESAVISQSLLDQLMAEIKNRFHDLVASVVEDMITSHPTFIAIQAALGLAPSGENNGTVLPESGSGFDSAIGSNAAGAWGGGGGSTILPFVVRKPLIGDAHNENRTFDEVISGFLSEIETQTDESKQRLKDKSDDIINQDFTIARDKALQEIMHLYAEVASKIARQRDDAIAAIRAAQPKQSQNADNLSFQTTSRQTLD